MLLWMFFCAPLLTSVRGLELESPPFVNCSSDSGNVVLIRFSDTRVRCSVTGNPKPKLEWKVVGVPDKASQEYREAKMFLEDYETDDGLVIPFLGPFSIVPAGGFQLTASNPLGQALSDIFYFRAIRHKAFEFFKDVAFEDVSLGGYVALQVCKTDQFYPSIPHVDVSWHYLLLNYDQVFSDYYSRERETFPQGAVKPSKSHVIDSTGQLWITDVEKADVHDESSENLLKLYFCRVYHRASDTTYESGAVFFPAIVNEHAKPSSPEAVYTSETSVLATAGSDISLFCIFHGHPAPVVTWKMVSGEGSEARHFVKQNGSEYLLRNVQAGDAGEYECMGGNSEGTDTVTFTLRVTEPPTFTTPMRDYLVSAGSDVTVWCNTSGAPGPQVDWYSNGVPSFNTGAALELMSLEQGGSRVVQCNASNSGGYAFRNTRIHVVAQPPAPVGLRYLECSNRRVQLAWQMEELPHAPVSSFTLEERNSRTSGGWSGVDAPLPGHLRDVKFSVAPWGNYTFRLRAQTAIGSGKWAEVQGVCVQSPGPPAMNPRGVVANKTGNQTVTVSWQALAPEEEGGPGLAYWLKYRRPGDATWAEQTMVPASSTTTTRTLPGPGTWLLSVVSSNDARGECRCRIDEIEVEV